MFPDSGATAHTSPLWAVWQGPTQGAMTFPQEEIVAGVRTDSPWLPGHGVSGHRLDRSGIQRNNRRALGPPSHVRSTSGRVESLRDRPIEVQGCGLPGQPRKAIGEGEVAVMQDDVPPIGLQARAPGAPRVLPPTMVRPGESVHRVSQYVVPANRSHGSAPQGDNQIVSARRNEPAPPCPPRHGQRGQASAGRRFRSRGGPWAPPRSQQGASS